MRVLHLGKYYPPARGGIESHVQTLAHAQAALGAEVEVLCVNHAAPDGRDVSWRTLARSDTAVEHDGAVRVRRSGRVGSIARLDVSVDLCKTLCALLPGEYDVIHLHVPNPAVLLPLAVIDISAPLIVSFHADSVRQRVLRQLVRPFEHVVLRRAAAIVCASPTMKSATRVLRNVRDRACVIPMGIDLAPYQQPSDAAIRGAAELRREHGETLWVTLSRLVRYKGLHNAIDALVRVRGRLLIIGSGPLEAELRARATARGVAHRIVWMGAREPEEVVSALLAATALWFPSNTAAETCGLAQIEAMAAGCPVINSAIQNSGVSWVSPHELSGLTCSVDDPVGLAAAATRLLDEPGLREELAAGGRARATRHFSDQRMASRTLDLYQSTATAPSTNASPARSRPGVLRGPEPGVV